MKTKRNRYSIERGRVRVVAAVAAAAVAAAVTGAVVTVAVAFVTAAPAVCVSVGALASAMVWAVMVWRYGGHAGRPRRGFLTVIGMVLAAGALASLLVPLDDAQVTPTPPPGAGVWRLPDGTHLAYGVVHARSATAVPVVVLHGGPGIPELAADLAALRGLTADGHDVYAYAQLGAGNSSRLADPSGYTVARAINDLEQVRQRIGASRLILVGYSYGAFLAAAYLAARPNRVAKVIFSSPGDLDDGLSGTALQSALSWQQRLHVYGLLGRPRLLLTYALLQVNPAAAHAFAGDHELDPRMAQVTAATGPALHCDNKRGPVPYSAGFYANQTPQSWHHPPVPDIRARLRTIRAPALVVKGQCDYLDWQTAADYIKTIPDARLAYLRGAGHDLKTDQPAAYLATIRAFLAGRHVPHLLATPTVAPAGYQPGR